MKIRFAILLALLSLFPTLGAAQSLPSPAYKNLTLNGNVKQADNSLTWSSLTGIYSSTYTNLGGYPDSHLSGQGGTPVASAIAGATSVPASVPGSVFLNNANGVVGYCETASIVEGCVGVQGFGTILNGNTGISAWGANFATINGPIGSTFGFGSSNLYGTEIDFTALPLSGGGAPGGNGRGIYLVNASNAQYSSIFAGIDLARVGSVPWKNGLLFEDGVATNAISIGQLATGSTQGSQTLIFNAKNSSGTALTSTQKMDTSGNFLIVPSAGTSTILAKSDGTSAFAISAAGVVNGTSVATAATANTLALRDAGGSLTAAFLSGTGLNVNSGGVINAGIANIAYPGTTNRGLEIKDTTGTSGSAFVGLYGATGTLIGSISNNGNSAVAYNTTSDRRLKTDIKPSAKGLDSLLKIKVEEYAYKADKSRTVQQGFIAQDMASIYPEAVHVGGKDPGKDPWGVDYGRMTPLVVKSVQDLNGKVEDLQAKLEAALAEIAELKANASKH